MSANGEVHLLMAGLPESGKSTYLAALYHYVRNAPRANLTLTEAPPERDYLIEIEETWLRLEQFERSRHPVPKSIDLALRHGQSEFTLSIPDIKGETYSDLWELGSWTSAEAQAEAGAAKGILLFVAADRVVAPKLIDVSAKRRTSGKRRAWDPKSAPTQTQLCDVLQTLQLESNEQRPIAIVASAWDTQVSNGLNPSNWLELRMPLLWQWIQTNEIAYRTFGISAQGGDLGDAKVRKRLAALKKPVDRIRKVEGCDDLIDPILWLLAS